MKTLLINYPEEIKCMIIAHASLDGNIGMRAIGTAELEEGMVTIDTERMVVDRQTGEVVKE